MAAQITPFNLKLLQLTPLNIGRMQAVTALDTFDGATKNFHPKGLFSTEIFGRTGDKLRMRNFAYIDIKAPILHPLVLRILGKLKRLYPEILFGKAYARWDQEKRDFIKATPLDGETGFTFFMDHFQDLVFDERMSDSRELNIKFLNKVRPVATNERIIVSPAGYRDYVIRTDGREEQDEVNDLYRRMLALANNITREGFKASPQAFDKTRVSMQRAFVEIYEYHESIVRGKNKLTEGKFLTRAIQYGTRNTITAQTVVPQRLFDPAAPGFHSTGVGLFQYLKAFQPVCTYQIKHGFLQHVFVSPLAPANLVNRKTLRREQVQVPTEMFDLWMSSEGMNRLFNYYGEEQFRHDEIVIGDHYLGLIYNDGKHYRLFGDIDELPENLDRKHVRPVTYTELFYDAVYEHTKKYVANLTRFPVTGFGSTYPSRPYLKPTMPSQVLQPMNELWQPDTTREPAYLFPVRGASFLNSIQPASNKLQNLGADYDGDKMSFIGLFLAESVQECHRVLSARNFHVRTDGTIAHSLATDTVKYLMKGLLRNVVKAPAKEGYREERGGTFTHKGVEYNLNRVFAYIEKHQIPKSTFSVDKLAWVLDHAEPEPARVARADVTKPIIVVGHFDENRTFTPAAVDGLHRVARAVRDKKETIEGYRITLAQLRDSQKEVSIEGDVQHAPIYQDVGEGLPHHLTTPTQMVERGGLLGSTITAVLRPAIPNFHQTTELNGVLMGIPADNEQVPVANLGYPRSYADGLSDEEIEAADTTQPLDVEYVAHTQNYYVLGPYNRLAKLLRSKAEHALVRKAFVSH